MIAASVACRWGAPLLVGLVLAGCMPSAGMTPERAPGRTCPALSTGAWYFPEQAADNAPLEEWCRTVGPPVVQPRPSGRFVDLAPGEELVVLSWNVDVGGGDLLSFLRDEASLHCAGKESTLQPGGSPFVLLVQEAFRSSAEVPESTDRRVLPRVVREETRPGGRPDILEVAGRCGLSLVYVAAARNGDRALDGRREDKGVAILSTLPLTDPLFIELPYEGARRVAVTASMRSSAGHGLRLVNVHFTSAVPPARILVTGNGSRLRQALAVADVLSAAGAGSPPSGVPRDPAASILLGGDFNTWSEDETALRRLRDVFPDSPPPLRQPTRGAFPTDHILFRQGSGPTPAAVVSSYERVESRYHSDHLAIRMRVRFPE